MATTSEDGSLAIHSTKIGLNSFGLTVNLLHDIEIDLYSCFIDYISSCELRGFDKLLWQYRTDEHPGSYRVYESSVKTGVCMTILSTNNRFQSAATILLAIPGNATAPMRSQQNSNPSTTFAASRPVDRLL